MGSLQHGPSRLSTLLFGSLALLLATSGVHAEQEFPAKAIRLIVPAPTGSVLDVVARPLPLELIEIFKQVMSVSGIKPESCFSSLAWTEGSSASCPAACWTLSHFPLRRTAT